MAKGTPVTITETTSKGDKHIVDGWVTGQKKLADGRTMVSATVINAAGREHHTSFVLKPGRTVMRKRTSEAKRPRAN